MGNKKSPGPMAGLKFMGLIFAALISQGMDCSEHHRQPSLATIHLNDIHLQIIDPASGTTGVFLGWNAPLDGKVSYYEIYQSNNRDSLKSSGLIQPASDTPSAILTLPDSSRPMTVYYAVRSIWVEPTGQKLISDTLVIDSITVLPSFSILSPFPGSIHFGRSLHIEMETNSDQGILLTHFLYEKKGSRWSLKQQACLPADGCEAPIFGPAVQRQDLVLEDVASGDTVASLICVKGTESFQGYLTGLIQSLSCSRYSRVRE